MSDNRNTFETHTHTQKTKNEKDQGARNEPYGRKVFLTTGLILTFSAASQSLSLFSFHGLENAQLVLVFHASSQTHPTRV